MAIFGLACGQSEELGLQQARIVTGKVKNLLSTNEAGIGSATVFAQDVISESASGGAYTLPGVPPEGKTVSAAAAYFSAATVSLSGESASIPLIPKNLKESLGMPVTTEIVGKIVDGKGYPISGKDTYLNLVFDGYATGCFSPNPDGTFACSVMVKSNGSLAEGYMVAFHKAAANVYNAALIKIEAIPGRTIEVGTVVVDAPVATIKGKVMIPQGYSLKEVGYGLLPSSGTRLALGQGEITGDEYVIRMPATPLGIKFSVFASAARGNNSVIKYIDDLVCAGGAEYGQNITLPRAITPVYPAAGKTGVSIRPRFEWSSAGEGFTYLAIIAQNQNILWTGYTRQPFIEYPAFPPAIIAEAGLRIKNQYLFSVIGFKNPGLNIKDVKREKLQLAGEKTYMGSILFTVGETALNRISNKNAREFDQVINNLFVK